MGKSLLNSIFLTLILFISSVYAFSQQQYSRISLDYDDITLPQLIDTIRSKADIKIAYDVNSIPVDSLLSVHVIDKDPLDALKILLYNSGVEILFNGNQVIIREKQKEPIRFFRLGGRVIDYNNQPVSLVNISFINRPIGTVTNNMGEFEFSAPVNYFGDTLFFSCLGYKVAGVPIISSDLAITVKLSETSVSLPEVIIKYRNVNEIVESFKKYRKENYLEDRTLFTAFFRETVKQNDRFVNVSEAALEIIKYPYDQPFKLEHVKFIKGRKYQDVEKMRDINFRIEGGPFYFSRIDIARYMDFFPADDEEPIYKYKLEGLDYEYDRMVYLVTFEPITDNGDLLYKGVLRIDTETYALISAEFELTKNTLHKSRKYLIRKESRKVKAKPYYARYSINYRPYENRWVLNKLIGELKIYINDKKNKNKTMFTAVTELLMSDFKDAGKIKFKPSELYKSNYILTDKIKDYDPEFWKDYNVIKPDEDIENVFKKSH